MDPNADTRNRHDLKKAAHTTGEPNRNNQTREAKLETKHTIQETVKVKQEVSEHRNIDLRTQGGLLTEEITHRENSQSTVTENTTRGSHTK